ncbi:MAG: hypothetical protein IAG13_30130 [Deltaproteobacteria bacterium]|nr:hypothetical protein [Nannocystaceae bacterium]
MLMRTSLLPLAALALACSSSAGRSSESAAGDTTSGGSDPQSTTEPDPSSTEAETSSGDAPADSSESSDGGVPPYECATPPSCDATPGAGPVKVELRVHDIDDIVLAEVNGLRRGFWSIPTLPGQDSGRIDISSWFSRGSNQLRILAANTGGPAGFGVQVWVDDALVLDATCDAATCPPGVDVPLGYFFDESLAIDSEAFPCPQQVCVHGEEEGSLYIDGKYTGARAPVELMLPPGGYELGIGSGTDDPPFGEGPTFEHEGRMRKRTVAVESAAVEVELGDADLVGASQYDFLVVPIRNVQYTNGQTGVLADEVPVVLGDAIDYASLNMVEPFSYGQASFRADVHPMIETTVVADADGFVAIDMGALAGAGLDEAAVAAHDVVVWAYSSHLADGTPVDAPPCCAWGGGSQIWMHTGWVYEPPIIYYVFIHEWLHTTEDELISLGYGGADGVHGADEHGYMSGSNGEDDFAQFYRVFIRGQVAEANTWVGAVGQLFQPTMMSPPSGAVRALRACGG